MIDNSGDEPFIAGTLLPRLGSHEVTSQCADFQGKFDSRFVREGGGPLDLRHAISNRSIGVKPASDNRAARQLSPVEI